MKEVFKHDLDFHFTCSFLASWDYKPSEEVGVSKGLEGDAGVDAIMENIDGEVNGLGEEKRGPFEDGRYEFGKIWMMVGSSWCR